VILLRLGAALLVLLSLFGFGETLSRRLALSSTPFQSATIGLCLFLAGGGFLGVAGLYGTVAVSVLIGAGVLLGLFHVFRRLVEQPAIGRSEAITALPFLVAGILVLLTAQHGFWFVQGDDMQGYLPLIKKLVQTGVLGSSSFSEKDFFDLGGASVLQGVFVGWFGVSAVNLADLGIGGLLLLGLIGERAAVRRYGLVGAAILVWVALALNEDARPVSPVLLIEAPCLMLVLWMWEDMPLRPAHFIVWGVVAAALIALKSTAIVFLGVLSIGVFCANCLAHGPGKALKHAVMAAVVALCCVAPYLYASVKYAGTPLYPLLGTGFQAKELGDGMLGRGQATWNNLAHFVLANQQLEIVLLVAAGMALFALGRAKILAIGGIAIAAALVAVALEIPWATFAIGDSDHGVRYALPFYAALLLGSMVDWRIVTGGRLWGWLFAAALVVAIPYCARDPDFSHPSLARSDFVYGLTGSREKALAVFHPFPIFPLEEGGEAVARLQQAAKPGTGMLVVVDRPYQMDFARNRIETVDCPGRVSPPPGMPLYGSDAQMVSYLRASGIRYLAFSYGDNANYTPALMQMRMKQADHPWSAYCSKAMVAMQGFLRRARTRAPVVYDDGQTFLIDLSS
jgi:hypothetical protein